MQRSTKTALVIGGAVVIAGGAAAVVLANRRKGASTGTPSPKPPTQVAPSPRWQIGTISVTVVAAEVAYTATQALYGDSTVLMPQALQQFSLTLTVTNVSQQNQLSYFSGVLTSHGTGTVIMRLQQLIGYQEWAPKTVITRSLTPTQALVQRVLPTGYADLQISALSPSGQVLQTFNFPNVIDFTNGGSSAFGGLTRVRGALR